MVLWTFFVIAGTGENWKGVPKYQRGSTKAWKRGTFEMWIEYGRPSWQQLSSVTRFRDDNTWAWKVPVGAHTSNFARREPYFSPKFSHISPPTDLICVIFIWIVYVNKGYHCNKNGAKRPSSWSDTPFWPISLWKNQHKGCQKGGKPTFTNSIL